MTLNSRLSFLTTALCSLAFLFSAPVASAAKKPERVVGSVKIDGNSTALINGKTAGSGAVLRCGDLIETSVRVQADFTDGPSYIIDPGTRVRLTCNGPGSRVQFLVSYGGIHPLDSVDDDFEQIPYNPALGVGNGTFPSIGGGPSSTTGKIPIFNSQGVVIGYALTDANGRVVAFTNTTGGVLAVPGPNGTPVSSVFGAGATGANLL